VVVEHPEVSETLVVPTALGPVAVRMRGGGPLLVALHANPGDGRDYDAVLEPLARRYLAAVVDWPGFGASQARDPEAVTAPALAGALDEVLDALMERAGQRSAVLVGNSVGGYAAVCQALCRPERVRGMVLIAPGGFTRTSILTRAFCRMQGNSRIAGRLVGTLATAYTRRRTPASRAALRRARAVRDDGQRLAVYCAIWRSFADPAHDLRERVGRLRVPVLLTWGRADPVLPWFADGRRAARLIPAARVCTFACGHEPHAEVPEQWLAAVVPFLDALPAPGVR
jgi:pimeloyl-ACP methyl ester carboxylesterase